MTTPLGICDALALHLSTHVNTDVVRIAPDNITVEFLPVRSIDELVGRPWLTIVPRGETETRAARFIWEHTYRVSFAMQVYVKAGDDENADENAPTVDMEAIRGGLAAGRSVREAIKQADRRFDGAVLQTIESESTWRPDHLAEQAVLTGVYTATFQADDDYTDT